MTRDRSYAIILPVYNGVPLIRHCIDGIISQHHRAYQLIVLDNCSTDSTREYLASINDPRITVSAAPVATSIEANWSRIRDLPIAPDTFVTLIGHDDVLYPEFLTQIDRLIDQHPKASLYQTLFHLIDRDGRNIRDCRPIAERESAIDFLHQRIAGQRDSFGTGYVFRFREYCEVGGITRYPSLLWSDDMLWLRLSQRSYKACDQSISFAYRFHRQSESGRMGSNRPLLVKALSAFIKDLALFFPHELANRYTEEAVLRWALEIGTSGLCFRSDSLRQSRANLEAALIECFPGREPTIRLAFDEGGVRPGRTLWATGIKCLRAVVPPILYSACALREPWLRARLFGQEECLSHRTRL